MSWITIALAAQLLTALTIFVDRYLLVQHTKGVGKPIVLAFYSAVLSGLVIVFPLFGIIAWPSAEVFWLSILYAIVFVISLMLLYRSLQLSGASDAMPVVTAISTIVAFCAALFLINENLSAGFYAAIVFFVIGTFLIPRYRFSRKALQTVLATSVAFGILIFLTKYIYLQTDFWNGFFWPRMANVALGGLLLLIPSVSTAIFARKKQKSEQTATHYAVINKVVAGIASALIGLAIYLGDVSVVSAMGGIQFALLIILAYAFAHRFPRVFGDETDTRGRSQKFLGVACIIIGTALLYLV